MNKRIRIKTKEEMYDLYRKDIPDGWISFRCKESFSQSYLPTHLGHEYDVAGDYKDHYKIIDQFGSKITVELEHCEVVNKFELSEELFKI